MTDNINNPMNFFQSMWKQMGFQLPGMVTPTLDEGELEKQINDLKSVENWLRMNLSMLQMTIQNLEMQKSAISTFRSMGEQFASNTQSSTASDNPFSTFFQQNTSQNNASPHAGEPSDSGMPSQAQSKESSNTGSMWPWEMMSELNAKFKEQMALETKGQEPQPSDSAAISDPVLGTKAKTKPSA